MLESLGSAILVLLGFCVVAVLIILAVLLLAAVIFIIKYVATGEYNKAARAGVQRSLEKQQLKTGDRPIHLGYYPEGMGEDPPKDQNPPKYGIRK